jgi:hypothetical protein
MQRILVAGFAALAAFQLLLAAGAPLGHAAWGGEHAHLTAAQRIGSGVSVLVFLVAIAIIRRGYHRGALALAALMTLSALANVASSSAWERFLLAPAALVLAVLCVAGTRSAPRRAALLRS